MELIYTILIVVVVLVALYFILGWTFQKSTQLTSLQHANKHQKIPASQLANSGNSSNYAFSTWFYVEDWNTNYGQDKVLLNRQGKDSSKQSPKSCPKIYLGARENDIHIDLTVYGGSDLKHLKPHSAVVRNFPLQKWVNLIISLYGRTLDIYIDGKLVQSDILSGVAVPCNSSDVEVTPDKSFDGWTSNFKYWSHALNPQEAYNVYKDGYGGSSLGNIFNKYRVKVSFLEDNKEEASFEI